jgi:hypothetical protein
MATACDERQTCVRTQKRPDPVYLFMSSYRPDTRLKMCMRICTVPTYIGCLEGCHVVDCLLGWDLGGKGPGGRSTDTGAADMSALHPCHNGQAVVQKCCCCCAMCQAVLAAALHYVTAGAVQQAVCVGPTPTLVSESVSCLSADWVGCLLQRPHEHPAPESKQAR